LRCRIRITTGVEIVNIKIIGNVKPKTPLAKVNKNGKSQMADAL